MPDSRDGLPAVGRSKDVVCPVCKAPPGVRCGEAQGNHVERGRQARWMQMGFSTDHWQD